MTDKESDRIKRIEEIVTKSFHLARLIRRKGGKSTKIYNDNFELLEENIARNTANIDKIVKTLQGLIGEDVKKKPIEQSINQDSKRIYL